MGGSLVVLWWSFGCLSSFVVLGRCLVVVCCLSLWVAMVACGWSSLSFFVVVVVVLWWLCFVDAVLLVGLGCCLFLWSVVVGGCRLSLAFGGGGRFGCGCSRWFVVAVGRSVVSAAVVVGSWGCRLSEVVGLVVCGGCSLPAGCRWV